MSEPGGTSKTSDERDMERMLCSGCMAPNDPRADYCEKCGMPVGACAGTDPLKSIYLQGRLYQHAASGRPPLIALIGMWVLFGPFVVFGAFGAAVLFGGLPGATGATAEFSGLLALPVLALYAAVLYRVTRNYVRSRRVAPGSCKGCGYNLFGLTEPRCPECGRPFNWEEVQEELESDEPRPAPRPRPPLSQTDLAYAIAIGLCYTLALGPAIQAILQATSDPFISDLLYVIPCSTQVVGSLLLLSGIRQLFRRREKGLSRLFVITFVADILLTLGIGLIPLAFL